MVGEEVGPYEGPGDGAGEGRADGRTVGKGRVGTGAGVGLVGRALGATEGMAHVCRALHVEGRATPGAPGAMGFVHWLS